MHFESCILAQTENEEDIIDYAYISEDNFLLVIGLTSNANLIIYYRSGSLEQIKTISARNLYPEWLEPVLITILSDASVVCLIQNNGDALIIPIRLLIDVNWCTSNSICSEPILIKTKINESNPLFKLPTCVISFISRFANKPYVLYGNKGGRIIAINLITKTVSACLKGQSTITDLQLHYDNEFTYLLITEGGGYQTMVALENSTCSFRETLAYFNPETFDEKNLKFFCFHHNKRIMALNTNENFTFFYDKNNKKIEEKFKVPETTWMIDYNNKAIVCITESNHVYYNLLFLPNDDQAPYLLNVSKIDEKILGIIPVANNTDELDDCFIITEKRLNFFKSKLTLNEVILKFLSQEYFSSSMVNEIANRLGRDIKNIVEQILELTLVIWSNDHNNALDDKDLNGALSLAMEIQLDMDTIIKILSTYNGTELIVPFLIAMCEKDGKYWNNLLEVYEIKLKKLKKQDIFVKESLERDLKECFFYCSPSKSTFKLFLKNEMWSSVITLLTKDPIQYSDITAEYLMELQSLNEIPSDQLSKCLNLISWNNLESFVLPMLTKAITCLANVEDDIQLGLFASFGLNLVSKSPIQSLVLYSIATIRYLYFAKLSSSMIDVPYTVLSVGSNCFVAINCENKPLFWGEFSAGGMHLQNDNRLKLRKKGAPSPQINKIKKTVLYPKRIIFSDADEPKIISSVCGTETVLLLSSEGIVYSFGKNTFGQCGVGHKNEVLTPIPIINTYGKAKKIFSGHYHSGLINENDEVFLWGWAVHGQLAIDVNNVKDYHDCRLLPSKVTILPTDKIINIALGYAHTLFLTENGDVYGCGATSFGQLAMVPEKMKGEIKELTSIKCFSLYKIPVPEPVRLLSSNYFHSIAVGQSETIYEWGSCPLSVKIKMCLTKKFNNTIRDQLKKQLDEGNNDKSNEKDVKTPNSPKNGVNTPKSSPTSSHGLMQKIKSDVTKDYMKISIVEKWPNNRSPIKHISAGYSHSALLTENGEIYTWGKSLDMQLGHGNKIEKEKPTKLAEPAMINWKMVIAGRSMSTAVSSCGKVYVWGRNDKYQLGLGYTKKNERKFTFKNKEQKSVELPDDNCISTATPIPGLIVPIYQATLYHENEHILSTYLMTADQQTLVSISRNLVKHPIMIHAAAQVHIAAGDILHAVDVLCGIKDKNKTNTSNDKNLHVTSPQKSYSSLPKSTKNSTIEMNRNTPPPTFPWNFDDKNGNSTEGLLLSPTSVVSIKSEDDVFDELLEKLWNLIRIHPFNDIQTLALLKMLQYKFPIYNRLALDVRLCRLVDQFLEFPLSSSPNSSVHSVESAGHRRLIDMTSKDRFMALKNAKLAPPNKIKALKQRSEQSSSLDQLRFYTDCGHYEKCVVESGSAKAELAALRNKLRKCSRCAVKGKIM